MSWNFSAEVGRENAAADLHDAADADPSVGSREPGSEVDDQVTAAIDAAVRALECVGTAGPFRVNLSGHANPGHGKAEGYANEMISVSVTEK